MSLVQSLAHLHDRPSAQAALSTLQRIGSLVNAPLESVRPGRILSTRSTPARYVLIAPAQPRAYHLTATVIQV